MSSATCAGGEVNASSSISAVTIAQGDGESNREGRRCDVLSVNYKGCVSFTAQANQTTADISPTVYIAMVLDKQTNGAEIVSEDVFQNPSGGTRLCTQPLTDLANQKRYTVLKSWRLDTDTFASAYGGGSSYDVAGRHYSFNLYHKFKKPLRVTYGGTAENINIVADNSVQLIAFASATSAAPVISYNSRTRFMG